MIFSTGLYVLAALCTLVYLYTKSAVEHLDDPQFNSFQRSYLTVYLLAVAGDWLQGPHVYALYDSYNMSKHEIELLFIAGFGSSLLFGTFVGSIADKYGRKTNCFLYAVLYIGACITKHFGNFYVLLLGRLLGGIATSILFSAFESWLVYEHNKRGFGDSMLSTIFSHATFGNSLVAITSGLVAQVAADTFGYVAPFDVAMVVLVAMAVILIFTWPENYGDSKAAVHQSFVDAYETIRDNTTVLYLGLIQSLFEGAMYTFVLEWTPALSAAMPNGEGIPHGYIFASFMIAVMMGSSIFKVLVRHFRPESFMRVVLLCSACCLATPIFLPHDVTVIFVSFIVFEMCVGIFWPAMGYLRGKYVPEQTRSTTMNFFRVPLNLIVVIVLLQNLSMYIIFQFCVLFLLLATFTQQALYSLAKNSAPAGGLPSKTPLFANDDSVNGGR
ncbi:Major facilitator superfamily domain-containing protein 5 [Aphelenchoides avenae]|nr:Major facilitator superfamily domain-containing protein 5 [Aphelenchus avenae]